MSDTIRNDVLLDAILKFMRWRQWMLDTHPNIDGLNDVDLHKQMQLFLAFDAFAKEVSK